MDHIEVFRHVGYPSQCDCTDTGGHYCKSIAIFVVVNFVGKQTNQIIVMNVLCVKWSISNVILGK